MKAAVIVSPGSNCDRDIQVALRQSAGVEPIMHWHKDPDLPVVDMIVIPGGFSFGDYLRAGAMAAHSSVIREVIVRAKSGVPILGICNGFQILTECGLLPGVLMRNAQLKFICRDVDLRVEAADTVFTRSYLDGQVIRIPVAHNEGNYFADDDTLNRLDGENRVAFRYCTPNGNIIDGANPNGAARNIAGILNENRNVLGMMPHPERLADTALGGTDGRPMFDSLVEVLSGIS
ncbi:MAG: Phosphoribosylformylglycinamidine synthase subunit PurQ [Alphaproteobacteria bacterium MarineAlpha11_Bin1]|nr:MAG: Phosphoribosylformylglycinamidine synthase subunit PurQ [Alphaproteobacteria bacterium MarineAlpha11_Bin1]|tara:strand:- start:3936 stop:4634 length:699 start_codon:yes stop_codon:yes gene_type:complete